MSRWLLVALACASACRVMRPEAIPHAQVSAVCTTTEYPIATDDDDPQCFSGTVADSNWNDGKPGFTFCQTLVLDQNIERSASVVRAGGTVYDEGRGLLRWQLHLDARPVVSASLKLHITQVANDAGTYEFACGWGADWGAVDWVACLPQNCTQLWFTDPPFDALLVPLIALSAGENELPLSTTGMNRDVAVLRCGLLPMRAPSAAADAPNWNWVTFTDKGQTTGFPPARLVITQCEPAPSDTATPLPTSTPPPTAALPVPTDTVMPPVCVTATATETPTGTPTRTPKRRKTPR